MGAGRAGGWAGRPLLTPEEKGEYSHLVDGPPVITALRPHLPLQPSLSADLIGSSPVSIYGAGGLLCPWHGLCDPPSPMRKSAPWGHTASSDPGLERKGEANGQKGLPGRKEVGATMKVRAWPPFAVPASQGASSWDPRAPKARGTPARAGVAAGIPPTPLTLAKRRLPTNPRWQSQNREVRPPPEVTQQ